MNVDRGRRPVSSPTRPVQGWLLLLVCAAIFPNLVWIAVDKTAWPWDQAWYGKYSVELFFTLIYSPSEWLPAMLEALGRQAPGIAWVGQFFVPVGLLAGSIDAGLLLSIVCMQALALLLICRALWELAGGGLDIPALGLVVMASAPLCIALSHYYLVEMMQTTAVAWFVFIMARAPSWRRLLIVAQLTLATTFAMLAKVSSPLFCFGPGLVALYYIARSGKADHGSGRPGGITLAVAIPVGLATIAWYHRNLAAVIWHVSTFSSGPLAELYGKSDRLLPSLEFWLSAVAENFFSSLTSLVAAAAVAVGIVAALAKRDLSQGRLLVAAGVSAVQIAISLLVFSLSSNRDDRYLLPLLPYVVLVLCWSLAQVNRRLVTYAVMAVFALQWAHVHAQSLGLLPKAGSSPRWLNAAMSNAGNRTILDSLVERTCADTGSGFYWNAVGVQLLWLNPPGVSYAAAKRLAPRHKLACDYDAIAYYDPDANDAWDRLMARNIKYYIGLDAAAYEIPSLAVDRTLNQLNGPILKRVEESGYFTREVGIPAHEGILVYRRVAFIDHVTHGRALSDRGRHLEAIDELAKATVLEPTNVEAWANLALAYERDDNMEQAIAAATQARRLKPDHYYVNLGLARAYTRLGRWNDALARAEDAALNAPGTSEQVSALALAARSAFDSGNAPKGCRLLRRAATLHSSPELMGELSGHRCAR